MTSEFVSNRQLFAQVISDAAEITRTPSISPGDVYHVQLTGGISGQPVTDR
jgi:hypothetical protein